MSPWSVVPEGIVSAMMEHARMDLLPPGFLLLVALAAAGSFVYGVAGFGSGLVAIPLALHFHEARLVLAVFALLDCVNVVRVLSAQPRQAVRQEVVRLLPACVLGLVAGSLLLLVIAPRPLMLLLGAFVLVYAVWSLVAGDRAAMLSRGWAVPAGLASGLTSSMFGIGGPPYVIYLSRRGLDMGPLRATMAAAGLVSMGGRTLAFAMAGLLADPAVWLTALVALPGSLVALKWAEHVRHRLSPHTTRRVIEGLLMLSGMSLVVKAGGWS
jgi:uncharacterized protein